MPALTPAARDALKDGALAVLGHGFGDQIGHVDAPGGWKGMAEVSPVLLDNVGEHESADRIRMAMGDASPHPHVVIVSIYSDGASHLSHAARVGSWKERFVLGEWTRAEERAAEVVAAD